MANNLAPLLRDLRPTIADLRPTLRALDDLLDETPSLLDQARSTIPKATDAFDGLTPTLKTLRPFTPCVVGFVSTAFGNSALNHGEGQSAEVLSARASADRQPEPPHPRRAGPAHAEHLRPLQPVVVLRAGHGSRAGSPRCSIRCGRVAGQEHLDRDA